jgi:oligopeptide transport system substrate-binding protein
MKSWKHEYKLELEANPNYFDGVPKIKHLQIFMIPEQSTAFALYLSDQLDFLDNSSFPTPEVAKNASNPEYHNLALLKSYYVGFNVHKKPFDDKRVRLAISKAIDRSIFPKILRRQEKPIYCFIPKGLSGYVPLDPPEFNPEAAKKLLAEAGYPEGKGFPHVEILYPSREDVRLVVEDVQDQLKRNLGIQAELTNQEFKVYMNSLHRDPPPIFTGNWGADFPDPETFAGVFVSHNANNHTLWTNPQYDQLVSLAEAEQDPKKRIELYEKADHLLCAQEAAVACIYGATENIMVKPWVHGLDVNRIDLSFFKDVSVDNNWRE